MSAFERHPDHALCGTEVWHVGLHTKLRVFQRLGNVEEFLKSMPNAVDGRAEATLVSGGNRRCLNL